MMRLVCVFAVAMIVALPAVAGMTPEEMRKRIQEIDALLNQPQEIQIHSYETLQEE